MKAIFEANELLEVARNAHARHQDDLCNSLALLSIASSLIAIATALSKPVTIVEAPPPFPPPIAVPLTDRSNP